MDQRLLAQGRNVARRLNRRIQMTIPSILAAGETFSGPPPPGPPSGDFEGTIAFEGSTGIEGLPASVRFAPASKGMMEIAGLKAVGPEYAVVRADIDGIAIQSNPAWVLPEPESRLYWGDIHVHTTYSNCSAWSCKDPEFAYAYARDAAHLDFAAAADHLRGIASDPRRWPRLQQLAAQYDEPGRFTAFLAFESSHRTGFGGDNNAYYLQTDGPHFWLDRDDMRGAVPAVPLQTLWEFLDATGRTYFTAPHHTGRAGKYRSFADAPYDARREPLFEIYSAWGSSEMRHTAFPLHAGNAETPAYFADALRAGCRYGVIASSDDHTTLPGGESRNWGTALGPAALSGYHHMGLAAVRADELTRPALWQALTGRNTYGTTFARTIVDLRLGDLAMGQEAEVRPADPLRRKRRIRVRLSIADQRAATVVLVRNGRDIARQAIKPAYPIAEAIFEEETPLDEIALREAPFHPQPFVVYYARIETARHQAQWTSPIWLDL